MDINSKGFPKKKKNNINTGQKYTKKNDFDSAKLTFSSYDDTPHTEGRNDCDVMSDWWHKWHWSRLINPPKVCVTSGDPEPRGQPLFVCGTSFSFPGIVSFFSHTGSDTPRVSSTPPPLLFDSLHQLRQHPLISYRPTEPFRRDQLFIGVDRPLQFFTAAGAVFIKSTNAHGRLLTINNGYK